MKSSKHPKLVPPDQPLGKKIGVAIIYICLAARNPDLADFSRQ